MFKRHLHSWIEKYFYNPGIFEISLSFLLIPFSLIYSFVVIVKKKCSKKTDFKIPIISIGNLTLGGSGKTPLIKAIYNKFQNSNKIFIILRGYKRQSKGMIKICINGKILTDVKTSGDEAMEYAMTLQNANVIVSEDRKTAIKEAIKLQAQIILLDDGFSKFDILKFDILLKPDPLPKFSFTLPSGAYRYPTYFYKFSNYVPTKNDIIKQENIKNPTEKMVLVTAIAKPFRLEKYINLTIAHEFFPDHHNFNKEELKYILSKYKATSLLVTNKDFVKIKDFNLPISIIELNLILSDSFTSKLRNYIEFK